MCRKLFPTRSDLIFRLQRWRLRTLEEKVAVEREKLNRADEAEAAGVGGGSGAGEARRGVRRKLLDEAGDRKWRLRAVYVGRRFDTGNVVEDSRMVFQYDVHARRFVPPFSFVD